MELLLFKQQHLHCIPDISNSSVDCAFGFALPSTQSVSQGKKFNNFGVYIHCCNFVWHRILLANKKMKNNITDLAGIGNNSDVCNLFLLSASASVQCFRQRFGVDIGSNQINSTSF